MPGHFLPKKSGIHRIACIALYRALLEQCPRIPLPSDLPQGPVNPIKHYIRKRFKQHKNHTSPRMVVSALKAGYAGEQLLRTAGAGNLNSISQIHSILWTLHRQAEKARERCQRPVEPRSPPRVWAYPDAPKLLESRPLPFAKLTGKRTVPSIAIATQYVFLRFKKPQSPYLSRVLRQKIDRIERKHGKIAEMDELVKEGILESQWDHDVASLMGEAARNELMLEERRALSVKQPYRYHASWSVAASEVKFDLIGEVIKESAKSKEIADQMLKIRDQEMELWKEERRQRKYEKLLARNARRKERREKESEEGIGMKEETKEANLQGSICKD